MIKIIWMNQDLLKNNLPKGCIITYLVNNDPKFHYLYCPLFTSNIIFVNGLNYK